MSNTDTKAKKKAQSSAPATPAESLAWPSSYFLGSPKELETRDGHLFEGAVGGGRDANIRSYLWLDRIAVALYEIGREKSPSASRY